MEHLIDIEVVIRDLSKNVIGTFFTKTSMMEHLHGVPIQHGYDYALRTFNLDKSQCSICFKPIIDKELEQLLTEKFGLPCTSKLIEVVINPLRRPALPYKPLTVNGVDLLYAECNNDIIYGKVMDIWEKESEQLKPTNNCA